MNDILKSFGIGVAVASAIVVGTYGAARAIDGAERLYDKYKGKDKPEAKPAAVPAK
jgi:hypothetical protein